VSTAKPFYISKQLVVEAYKAVKANAGSAGIDEQSIKDFEKNLKDNLYRIWNRMSSGSYFPPSVKAVAIPKKNGGERILGIPTVSDRIAQIIVKMVFEPKVEAIFFEDSYGYRPKKSAIDAIGITRKRCWQYDWILEYDIKGMFDNIEHDLLMKAVRKHTEIKWVILYIERWLKAPMQMPDGKVVQRDKGTPQGGVISPVLANLFMHYTFDIWMKRQNPLSPWCRYADDGLIHCRTEEQAQAIKVALAKRLNECKLVMHPEKSRIVYCKDGRRRKSYENTKFDFLGYTFRARTVRTKDKSKLFTSFTPAVSSKALKAMRQTTRKLGLRQRTDLDIVKLSKIFNPILRGWREYYGKFYPSALKPVYSHLNRALRRWAMCKYERLRGHIIRASKYIQGLAKRQPKLFIHWELGILEMGA
jgi:RNA-directed DNA polymerase